MENAVLTLGIMVAILALVLIVVSRNKSKKISALEKELKLANENLSLAAKHWDSYREFFREPDALFKLHFIEGYLVDLSKMPTARKSLKAFADVQSEYMREFLEMQFAVLFERFVMGLPVKATSLEQIINFDYTYLREKIDRIKFNRNDLQARVHDFWICYLQGIDTSAQMIRTLEWVKDKPFFYFLKDWTGGNSDKDPLEWFVVWEDRFFWVLEKEQKQLNEAAEVFWGESNFDKFFARLKQLASIQQNEYLKLEHKDILWGNVKVFFRQSVDYFYDQSGKKDSVDLARMYAELKAIHEELSAVAKPETA